MKKKEKNILSETHLRKIKYRIGYQISESARYNLMDNTDEFDIIPLTNEAENDAEKETGNNIEANPNQENNPPIQPEPPLNEPVIDAPVPAFDTTGGDSGEIPNLEEPLIGEPTAEEQVDDIQNDIIKHNISAMKSIHDQLEGLNGVVQKLNNKLEILTTDVEEVREPTNSEKLMKKSDVSYPYYFNLNDFWSDNWFNKKREKEMEGGISKLPDGTYVADFDDLNTSSNYDIKNSFNSIV